MWTAWTLIATFAIGLVLYAVFAVHAAAAGAPLWALLAGAPLAYLAIVAAIVLGWFTLAWIFRTPRPPAAHIGPAASLHLVAQEFAAIAGSPLRMGLWWWRLRDPPSASAVCPVLLLHGVLCNAGVWKYALHELNTRGLGPVYTLSYGPPLASAERFAEQTARKIDAILAATGAQRVIVIGHSLGGLVARAYVRRYGSGKVARIVTVGTPHQGSLLARMFPGTPLRQLSLDNPWLAELNAHPSADGTTITSIWSWHDSMVVPQHSSELRGAINVRLTGIGHNALVQDPLVVGLLAAEIEAARDACRASTSGSRA